MKITFNSPVVLTFVLLCLAATLLGLLSGGYLTRLLFMTYRGSPLNPLTWLRLFTHVIGHSGWEHFIGNAMYLLLLGPMLEEKYGPRTIIGLIVLTAAVTGVINLIFFPGVALCGASGVVFAFILLASFTGFRDGEIPLTFLLAAAVYFGQQIAAGLFTADQISNLSHIIGGVIGAAAGYLLNIRSI